MGSFKFILRYIISNKMPLAEDASKPTAIKKCLTALKHCDNQK